jgi:flagellar assembly factor FliW
MSRVRSGAVTSAAPVAGDGDDVVVVRSRLLGDIPVRRADLLVAPAGFYGFEACRTFALVPAGREGLWWLQSVDRAGLVFLLADPFAFFPGYEVDLPPAELAHLDATEDTTLMALVIVTLPTRDAEGATANLRAPVIVDPARRLARQVVLVDDTLPLTAPLTL